MSVRIIEKKVPSVDGRHDLAGRVFLPDGAPKGLFHVVHGMTEHIGRYEDLMTEMAGDGYVCFGYDNLGHGRTVNDDSELGFIAHKDGWRLLADDVAVFGREMKREYGESLPYILMGHSMGSFIVRIAAQRYPELPTKLIVMGTGGPNPASGAGLAAAKIVRLFFGERHISPMLEFMAFGSYNKRFSEGEYNSWITKDPDIRRAYREDKMCAFHFTVSALYDLVKLNAVSNSGAWFREIRKSLPILLVSGGDDPVGDYGRGVAKVCERLKKEGLKVTMKIYDGCRHEILHDTCAGEVLSDIRKFIEE